VKEIIASITSKGRVTIPIEVRTKDTDFDRFDGITRQEP
jgi:hypothetical protein